MVNIYFKINSYVIEYSTKYSTISDLNVPWSIVEA